MQTTEKWNFKINWEPTPDTLYMTTMLMSTAAAVAWTRGYKAIGFAMLIPTAYSFVMLRDAMRPAPLTRRPEA